MTVLFDMDGVLVDVRGSYRWVIAETVTKLSRQPVAAAEIQELKDLGGCNNDWDLCLRLLDRRGIGADPQRVIELFQNLYWGREEIPVGRILNERWLLPVDVLVRLARDHRLGIVTGRPRREAEWTLQRFGVAEHFEVLVAHEDCPPGRLKPDPAGLNLALRRMGTDRAVYLGDTLDDRQAAWNAGLRFIGVVPPGGSFPGCFHDGACPVLKEMEGLLEVLINETTNCEV